MKKAKHFLPVIGALLVAISLSILPVRAAEQESKAVVPQEAIVQTIESVIATNMKIGEEEVEAILWAIEQGWVEEELVANPHVLAAMEEEEEAQAPEQTQAQTQVETQAQPQPTVPAWTGPVLTKLGGINLGPSGKESYYNLDMSLIVANMRALGYKGEYWVRNDGVKMFGDYIMCAANLAVRPRGSLVESSLGTCIVCDTGSFAVHNPTMLDIAVTW